MSSIEREIEDILRQRRALDNWEEYVKRHSFDIIFFPKKGDFHRTEYFPIYNDDDDLGSILFNLDKTRVPTELLIERTIVNLRPLTRVSRRGRRPIEPGQVETVAREIIEYLFPKGT